MNADKDRNRTAGLPESKIGALGFSINGRGSSVFAGFWDGRWLTTQVRNFPFGGCVDLSATLRRNETQAKLRGHLQPVHPFHVDSSSAFICVHPRLLSLLHGRYAATGR